MNPELRRNRRQEGVANHQTGTQDTPDADGDGDQNPMRCHAHPHRRMMMRMGEWGVKGRRFPSTGVWACLALPVG